MRRREFILLLGLLLGAAVAMLPSAGHTQQATKPVIGFLNSGSPGPYQHLVAGFLQGLKESGFVDGQNVMIEYRWAEGKYDRLSVMAADLVHRQVNVIAAMTTPAALAAEASKTTIPIIFDTAGDPVRLGLVASLNSARTQYHRIHATGFRIGVKATRAAARSGAQGHDHRSARESGRPKIEDTSKKI